MGFQINHGFFSCRTLNFSPPRAKLFFYTNNPYISSNKDKYPVSCANVSLRGSFLFRLRSIGDGGRRKDFSEFCSDQKKVDVGMGSGIGGVKSCVCEILWGMGRYFGRENVGDIYSLGIYVNSCC